MKIDYPGTASSTGFVEWFKKKSKDGSTALVFEDEVGVGAFVVLKKEEEEIVLQDGMLPAKNASKSVHFESQRDIAGNALEKVQLVCFYGNGSSLLLRRFM